MVLLVERDGLTFEAAAAASNVARSTCWEWVKRWRQASDEDRRTLACLEDRPSRPHTSPNQVAADEAARICERRERTGWSPRRLADEPDITRPHSTIHQVLRRGGCSRRPRPERPAIVRYEWPCPGQLLHMDVKKLGCFEEPGHALTADRSRRSRGAGWEYVHSIVDDCSRLAYSEIHPDEQAVTVAAFTRRALDWLLEQGVVCERLMTDNAFSYTRNGSLSELLRRRAIRQIRTRPSPLHAAHQWQGRALPPDPDARVGLRARIRLIRRPPRGPATLDQSLQRAPHPLSARQPHTATARSGRHRARQLAEWQLQEHDAGRGGSEDWVFPSESGTPLNADNLRNRVLRPAVKRANGQLEEADLPTIPEGLTLHDLRRSCCSLLFASGAQLPEVMERMRHRDERMTLRVYAKVMQSRAAEVDAALDTLLKSNKLATKSAARTLGEDTETAQSRS